MNAELFAELLESVREGAAILRGEKEPSRVFAVDVAEQQQPQQEDDKRCTQQGSQEGK